VCFMHRYVFDLQFQTSSVPVVGVEMKIEP